MIPAYTRTQIIIHWLTVLLIFLQFVLNGPMEDVWDQVRKGLPADMSPLVAQHVFGGLLILVLVVLRIAIRLRRGAPKLPENEPAILKMAAHATHLGLYGMLILVPVSGAVAWFGGVKAAAGGHEAMTSLMLLLIALHVGGALFHALVLKSGVAERMIKPRE